MSDKLSTSSMIQSIVAIVFGLAGLVATVLGAIGVVGGLLGMAVLLADLNGWAIWSLISTLVTVLIVLSTLVTSLLLAGGGGMALATRRVGLLGTAALLALLHIIAFEILWGLVSLGVNGWMMFSSGGDSAIVALATTVGFGLLGMIWSLIKGGLWGWTWMSSRRAAAAA